MRLPGLALGSVLLLLVVQLCAGSFNEQDEEDLLLERLLEQDASGLPQLTEEELRYLIGGGANAEYNYPVEEPQVDAGPRYPELSPSQRKFAVNPSFKSYKDASYRREEGVAGDEKDTDEYIDASLLRSAGKHKSGKKASEGALVGARGDVYATGAIERQQQRNDIYFTTVVAVSSALAVFAIVGAGFCYHRVRRNSKASEDVEYPAYGVTGPGGKDSHSPTSGTDRKLAQNAQMYHYQHQKQQMIAFDSASPVDKRVGGSLALGGAASDCESDDGEEGDYTVYECPGLAPTGEMEVHNPLFQDQDTTPKAK